MLRREEPGQCVGGQAGLELRPHQVEGALVLPWLRLYSGNQNVPVAKVITTCKCYQGRVSKWTNIALLVTVLAQRYWPEESVLEGSKLGYRLSRPFL